MERTQVILNTLANIFGRFGIWIALLGLSISGKLGLYLMGDKKYSLRQIMGSFLIAFSIGTCATIFCYIYYDGVVSLSAIILILFLTLSSDRLATLLMTTSPRQIAVTIKNIDYNKIIEIIFSERRKNKKE